MKKIQVQGHRLYAKLSGFYQFVRLVIDCPNNTGLILESVTSITALADVSIIVTLTTIPVR